MHSDTNLLKKMALAELIVILAYSTELNLNSC